MKKTCINALMGLMLVGTSSAYAQQLSPLVEVEDRQRAMLEATELNSVQIDDVMALAQQFEQTDEQGAEQFDNYVWQYDDVAYGKSLDNAMGDVVTNAVNSDNWQVVRIIAVASEDTNAWEYMDRYDTRTSWDHGGGWLLVATQELALDPLYGIISAQGKYNFLNASEYSKSPISENGMVGYQRFWLVQRNITSGEFKFEASYGHQDLGAVRLHRELDIR